MTSEDLSASTLLISAVAPSAHKESRERAKGSQIETISRCYCAVRNASHPIFVGVMSRSHLFSQALLLAVPCTLLVGAYRIGLFDGAANSSRNCRRRARGGEDPAGDALSPSSLEEEEYEEVERVLSLWFDGSTADNHRTKWFAQVCVWACGG